MSESIIRFIIMSVCKLVRLVAHGIIVPSHSSFLFHAVARWSMYDALSLHHVLTFAHCCLGLAILRNCNVVISTYINELITIDCHNLSFLSAGLF